MIPPLTPSVRKALEDIAANPTYVPALAVGTNRLSKTLIENGLATVQAHGTFVTAWYKWKLTDAGRRALEEGE